MGDCSRKVKLIAKNDRSMVDHCIQTEHYAVLHVTRDAKLMNRFFSILSLSALLFSACGTLSSVQVDKRDFAVDTYYPLSNEIHLAEPHARQSWQETASRAGTEPRYLAFPASSILA